MAGRRARSDGIAAAQRIVAGAAREVAPPSHIRLADDDWPYWHSVVGEFPKADWTDHQLEVAAQLAKAMADLETERNALRKEGYVNADGRANARHGVARDLTNSVMSLRRNLSLHARAQGGEARDLGKRKTAAKHIQDGVTFDDDLIARPSVN